MRIFKLISVSIIILLAGCTASGVKYSTQEEISNFKDNLYIYRSNSTLGSALQPTVYIDDNYLGSLENAGYIKHSTTTGEHTLKVGNKEIKYLSTNGEKQYFKYNVRTSLLFFITISPEQLTRVEEHVALRELTETRQSTHRVDQ